MDRAYQSGAAGSAPSAPVSPSTGYPTAGNPSVGTPATKPGPYWYHMIMEELMAIISAAGITPDQGNLTQLLTALRSTGVFQTPAQFDNTTKPATTEFVQRALGSFSGLVSYATNTTLTSSDAGGSILLSPGVTITLPAASAVPAGATFHFLLSGTGTATVRRNGADVIAGALSSTSVSLAQGDSLSIRSDGVSGWLAYEGTARMGAAGSFGSSLAASGYQKLPSGLIVQWGVCSPGSSATFPIAFPTACRSLAFSNNAGGFLSYSALSATYFTCIGATAGGGNYIAIGN